MSLRGVLIWGIGCVVVTAAVVWYQVRRSQDPVVAFADGSDGAAVPAVERTIGEPLF
jgi:hypothetical protein